ncbi:uncharacterized protein LOC108100432 isoform X2 [Drosophila ficusphila]|nr:uncharacterized protein LOC108100432 isoform X2 [Drosophila ficusphila]XP_043064455.1 uncharacterized protein LOC108100432 isoform X2 [Drosophila ficusphila]XP_043064456.1 uncharacterized protein LOC108100432 isoform X2 [Drosophila ficusphila]
MKSMSKWYIGFCFAISICFITCHGHGRLIEPPSRASAWRFGFQTKPDYNDHELYCGGFTRQWNRNGGKCGECGDAWDMPEPRPHEYGGQWGLGLIVRRYSPGAKITVRIELTASHMGYFEFRLCPNHTAKQLCLDQNILTILDGSPSQPYSSDLDTRFYPRNGSRIYEIYARLPNFSCDHCVLQWRYVAGNNWGVCSDGNGAMGCGPQEEFRSCSDIALTTNVGVYADPSRPLQTKPTKLINTEKVLESDQNEILKYSFVIAIVMVLVLCICIVYIWYIYNYDVTNVIFGCSFRKKVLNCNVFKSANKISNVKLDKPPIPPPRTKRLEKNNLANVTIKA